MVVANSPGQAQDAGGAATEALQAQFVNWILVEAIGQLALGQILQDGLLIVGVLALHLRKKQIDLQPTNTSF